MRQLSASLVAAGVQESQLAAHDRQRSKDAAALQALADELAGKAAAVQEAQAAAAAAVDTAHQLSAASDGLREQLREAGQREAALAAEAQQLQRTAAGEAAARAELQRQVAALQAEVAQYALSHTALQQQLEDAGVEVGQLAAGLRGELEDQHATNAALAQQADALAARAAAAEAEAGTAAGQLVSACEENARLAEQLADAQGQVRGHRVVGAGRRGGVHVAPATAHGSASALGSARCQQHSFCPCTRSSPLRPSAPAPALAFL